MQNLLTKRSRFPRKKSQSNDHEQHNENQQRQNLKKIHLQHSDESQRDLLDNISKHSTLSQNSNPSTPRSFPNANTQNSIFTSKWEWETCSEEIIRDLFDNQDSRLKPLNINNYQEIVGKNAFRIDIGKEFLYNENYGYHWHKSWTIPSIVILNDLLYDESNLNPNLKFQVQLKALKFLHEKHGSSKVHEISLKGETVKDFVVNRASFTKIKFSTTSFKNDGAKFHLVLNVTAVDQSTGQRSKCLTGWISPPLFIDSSSETKKSTRVRKTHGYFTPFEPKVLQKKFIKKEPDQNHNGLKMKIKNDFQGLYNYLSAVNIKQKIKHPIFLYFQFSKCFRLYHNTKNLNAEDETFEKQLLTAFQNILNEIEASTKPRKQSSILESAENNEGKQFIFYIDVPNDVNSMQSSRMVLDYLESLRHEALGFCFDIKMMPSYFEESNCKKIYQVYTQIYNELIKIPTSQDHSSNKSSNESDSQSNSGLNESLKIDRKKQKSTQKKSHMLNKPAETLSDSAPIFKIEECSVKDSVVSLDHIDIREQTNSDSLPNSLNSFLPMDRSNSGHFNQALINSTCSNNNNARTKASLLTSLNSKLKEASLSDNSTYQTLNRNNQPNLFPMQNPISNLFQNAPPAYFPPNNVNAQPPSYPQFASQPSTGNPSYYNNNGQNNNPTAQTHNFPSQSSHMPDALGSILSSPSFLQAAHNSSSLDSYLRNLYIDLYKKILNETEMIQLIEQILMISRTA